MELLFLGTGAADWNLSQRRGGEFFRRFSSLLVDGTLLIDPGPHIFDFAECAQDSHLFCNVRSVAITHSHADHVNADSLKKLANIAANDGGIAIYCDAAVRDMLIARGVSGDTVEYTVLLPFAEYSTADGYIIIPCRSNHGVYLDGECTLNYIVKKDGRSFFYGLDSGWIMYDTWQVIKKERPQTVIFECTLGNCPGDDRMFGHTGIPMLEIMIETMRAQHGPADDAAYYTSHMARTLHGTHEQLVRQLKPLGVIPAYDGMKVSV